MTKPSKIRNISSQYGYFHRKLLQYFWRGREKCSTMGARMAWETRNGRQYLYRSIREGETVRKEYLGRGRRARLYGNQGQRSQSPGPLPGQSSCHLPFAFPPRIRRPNPRRNLNPLGNSLSRMSPWTQRHRKLERLETNEYGRSAEPVGRRVERPGKLHDSRDHGERVEVTLELG